MRIHYFQHVPFEGLGYIETWLHEANAEVSSTRFFEDASLPRLAAIDGLIVLGGPMSVNEGDAHPWLEAETRYIAEAIGLGKPVLGICLGAQLIAKALGAAVYANGKREIGWFPIQRIEPWPLDGACWLPQQVEVFHWHGETFDLPPGTVRLASSAACANQAFALGAKVLGLQFHLEVTPQAVEVLAERCADELSEGGDYVQSAASLRRGEADYRDLQSLMAAALGRLFG